MNAALRRSPGRGTHHLCLRKDCSRQFLHEKARALEFVPTSDRRTGLAHPASAHSFARMVGAIEITNVPQGRKAHKKTIIRKKTLLPLSASKWLDDARWLRRVQSVKTTMPQALKRTDKTRISTAMMFETKIVY